MSTFNPVFQEVDGVQLSPIQFRIAYFLSEAGEAGLSIDELVKRVYRIHDTGHAEHDMMRSNIWLIRQRLGRTVIETKWTRYIWRGVRKEAA